MTDPGAVVPPARRGHGTVRSVGEDHDYGAVAEEVRALADEGLDLAIVYLLPPLTPAVLAPPADALAPLA